MTNTAGAMVDMNIFRHLSYRIASHLKYLRLPKMILILLWRLYRRLLYFTGLLCYFRLGI
jgi:hypothetical protein